MADSEKQYFPDTDRDNSSFVDIDFTGPATERTLDVDLGEETVFKTRELTHKGIDSTTLPSLSAPSEKITLENLLGDHEISDVLVYLETFVDETLYKEFVFLLEKILYFRPEKIGGLLGIVEMKEFFTAFVAAVIESILFSIFEHGSLPEFSKFRDISELSKRMNYVSYREHVMKVLYTERVDKKYVLEGMKVQYLLRLFANLKIQVTERGKKYCGDFLQ